MKKQHTLALAVLAAATCGFAGTAMADGPQLAPVVVSGYINACTPPNASDACLPFHQAIRAHFSPREIGILFGAVTPYPENLTGGRDRLMKRYGAFVQDYQASLNQVPSTTSVASR